MMKDAHKRGSGSHARLVLEKRQREPLPSSTDDGVVVVTRVRAATTTVAGRRPLPTTTTEDDDEETTSVSTPVRVIATTATTDDELDTSAPATLSLTRAPAAVTTTSTTPLPTTSSSTVAPVRRPLTTTTTSSPSSSATSATFIPATLSNSAGGISNTANDSSSTSSGGSGHTGAIAGAVIGVLALLAVGAFFGMRYRKKKQRAGEDAAIFQYGNQPGGGASVGKGAGGGYNQQIDSHEDLNGNNGGFGYNGEKEYAGYGANGISEKPVGSGMAGYGTLGLAAAAAAHQPQSHPNSYMSSPSHHSSMQQPSMFMNDYPPTPQQGYPQSARGSYGSNAPYGQEGGYPSHLQQPQPQMFVNTNVPPMGQQDSRSLTSPLGMAAGTPLPISPAGSNQRQSMNSVAAAAAAAALGGAAVSGIAAGQQQPESEAEGPFSDPAYEGKVFIVTRIFEPSMPDELVIYPGDRIQIVMSYDDGWCLGCNLDSSKRDGKPPARGVFPRDCVEELVENEDQPIRNSAGGDLQRAPTLPPLDMGNAARFSMSSASGTQDNKRASKRISRIAPKPNDSEADDEMEDAYGGVMAASSATPTRTAFPPEIQVQQHDAMPVSSFEDDHQQQTRLSVLQEGDEDASQLLDEFPSTPRTEASPSMGQQASPAGSTARLSVAGIPKSTSAQSIKRTSSLIASKDADLFLALGDNFDGAKH